MQIQRVNESQIIVSWTALTLVEARGHITHYTVYYWLESNSLQVFNVTVAHSITRVVIRNLLPGETYIVEISASTSVGEGSKSMEVYSTHKQGIIFLFEYTKLSQCFITSIERDSTKLPIAIGTVSAVTLVAVSVIVVIIPFR